MLDLKAHKVQLDLQVQLGLRVRKVQLDHKDHKAISDHRVRQVRKD